MYPNHNYFFACPLDKVIRPDMFLPMGFKVFTYNALGQFGTQRLRFEQWRLAK